MITCVMNTGPSCVHQTGQQRKNKILISLIQKFHMVFGKQNNVLQNIFIHPHKREIARYFVMHKIPPSKTVVIKSTYDISTLIHNLNICIFIKGMVAP